MLRPWMKVTLDAAEIETNASLREAVERVRLVAVILDRDGAVRYVNPHGCALLGYSLDELRGKDWMDVALPPEDIAVVRPRFRAVMDGPLAELRYERETGLVTRSGARRVISWSSAVLPGPDGRARGTASIGEDVTERRRAESIVRDNERRLAAALAATRQGTFDYDLLADDIDAHFAAVHPDDRAEARAAFAAFADGTTPVYQDEVRVRAGKDEWRWVHYVGAATERDAGGRPRRVVGTFRDVTERRRADAARADLEAQLRQAHKMDAIGRVARGIVHDFNNLLSVVLSYSRMILSDLPGDHPVREDVGEIHKAGERAAALTRQLLAFSRQQIAQPRVVDVNEIIGGMERMVRRVVGDRVELELQLTSPLAPVKADPGLLEQVLLNLIVNARDAMPDGGRIVVTTTPTILADSDAHVDLGVTPGPHVVLSVADTGVGMSADAQARLFEPFFTTKERADGLGLASVFGIVRQAGGWIGVRSAPGQGSTFDIHLPAAAEPLVAQGRRGPSGEMGTETILLVDDTDAVRILARNILHKLGYVVLDARGGADALALAESFSGEIHLLVTDVVMPGMSGTEVAQRVTRLRPGIKVLYMSGYAGEGTLASGILQSGAAFLQKPITPENLGRKVREILDEAIPPT